MALPTKILPAGFSNLAQESSEPNSCGQLQRNTRSKPAEVQRFRGELVARLRAM